MSMLHVFFLGRVLSCPDPLADSGCSRDCGEKIKNGTSVCGGAPAPRKVCFGALQNVLSTGRHSDPTLPSPPVP